jgi:probable HAF family extracellular repeat protein
MKVTKFRRILGAVALFGMMAALTAQAVAQESQLDHQKYKVVDLGTLGGSISKALGVNNRGDVVGFSSVSGDISIHAFLWRDGLMTDLGILGLPDPQPFSFAVSINDGGEVVGFSETSVPDPLGEDFCGTSHFLICLPVIWGSNAITALPTLTGTNGLANDVNESGIAGGAAENDIPDPSCTSPEIFHFEPVLWKNGRPIPLPLFGDDPDGFVLGVNDQGDAVGVTLDCSFNPGHSVFWRHGKAFDLNAPGADPAAEPNDLNNRSQITGTAFFADGSALAMLWQNGVTHVIGALPGHVLSHGNSINNKGQIVGQSCSPAGFPDCSVFLWENGVMRDLNDLVSDTLILVDSGKINDRGQIAGLGFTSNGEPHGFLATPENDDSSEAETSSALPKPQRPVVSLPELARKTLERQMFYKFRPGGTLHVKNSHER